MTSILIFGGGGTPHTSRKEARHWSKSCLHDLRERRSEA